jgi:hypothetical protein
MTARIASASPRALVAAAVGLVLVYAAALWLAVVSPARSDAVRAGDELAAAELRLVEARAAANRPAGTGVPVAEVLRLARVMPASADQAGLVLELEALAERSGVTLRSLTPQNPAVGAGGATMVPVSVGLTGRFAGITRFLRNVRTLVTVRRGVLRATGRLLVVQSVELGQSSSAPFPTLDATVSLQAYVYDGPIAPAGTQEEEPQPTGGTAAAGRTG